MKKFLLLAVFLFSSMGWAQSILLSVPANPVPLGSTVMLALIYSDSSPTANMVGLQWSLVLPAGITAGAPILGAASTAGAKVITCSPTGSICIDIGSGAVLNANVLTSGILATIPLTVTSSLAGTVSLSLAALGTTGFQTSTTAAGSTVSLTVIPTPLIVLPAYPPVANQAVP